MIAIPPKFDEWTREWTRSEADAHAVGSGCYFDLRAAERVRGFFRSFLVHSKGRGFAGKPFELLPWQWEGVIAPLFGWMRADGTRRYRKGGIWIAKKNGKSTLCAGIQLYMLVGDNEPGAEVYSAAADRSQASITYAEAANMVRASAALSSRLKVVDTKKHIAYHAAKSWLTALSSEVATKEGLNAHCIIFDELHAQKTSDLWNTLEYACAAREQPLQLTISTAGHDKLSIGHEQYDYAKSILESRNGYYDDEFFAYVSEALPEDDWTSPATWQKANPSWGVTIDETEMRGACHAAQMNPRVENNFRRYRLNQWTEQDHRWLPMDKWRAGTATVVPDDLIGQPCFGGLDMASTIDIAALVLVFPEDELRRVLCWFWVPEAGIETRAKRDRVPYDVWANQGWITATDGETIDQKRIAATIIGDIATKYDIRKIGFDRWGAEWIRTELSDEGVEVVAFGQGFASMSAPAKELESRIVNGTLIHGNNPVLTWMASNVAAERDAADNIKPSKKKSREKIDGIVALVMALGCAGNGAAGDSVYTPTRGLQAI